VKYLNNGIESDHAPIKKLTVATGGFNIRKASGQRFRGWMINKGPFELWLHNDEHKILIREKLAVMNRLFNIGAVYQ
jgi:transposase, IS6 family